MRYLVKKKGRKINVASIPKGAIVQKTPKGYRAKYKGKTGVVLKGYKLVKSKSMRTLRKRYPSL